MLLHKLGTWFALTALTSAAAGCFAAVSPGTEESAPKPDVGSGESEPVSGGGSSSASVGGSTTDTGPESVVLYIPADPGTPDATWTWNGSTWVDAHVANHPSNRDGTAMASDGHEIVLFGGFGFPNNNTLDDTWSWAHGEWAQLSPAASPPARSAHSMGSLGESVVLFGGYNATGADTESATMNDTWTWDGTTWTEAHPVSSPPARAFGSLAQLGNRLVLFGGADPNNDNLNDTWVWDGSTWTEIVTAASPPASFTQTMASLGNTVVLFSADDGADVTNVWIFDGSTWSAQPLPAVTAPALDHATAAISGTQVLLYGGYDDGDQNPLNDRGWAWDGAKWNGLGVSSGPAMNASGSTPCLMATLP